MEQIKASALTAAVQMTAALVLSDGKYEQWQGLFGKALNEATGLKWKDEGWQEIEEGKSTVHVLTFSCKATLNKKMTNVIIYFDETDTSYVFSSCEVVGIGSRAGKPIVKTANGKDLLAGILYKLVQMGAVGAGEYPAPPPDNISTAPAKPATPKGPMTTAAKVTQQLKAEFGLELVKFTSGSQQGKTLKQNGQSVKAIPTGASHGPMDVTQISYNKAAAKFKEVTDFASKMEGAKTVMNDRDLAVFQFNVGTPKLFTLALRPEKFGAYSSIDRMDPGYTNSYITVHTRDGD